MLLTSDNAYTISYASENAAAEYHNKFQFRVDRLRHQLEQRLLLKYASGDLFDCSIGSGRFVKKLRPVLSNYLAMDYSPDFILFVKKNYPSLEVMQADLEQGIPQPDNRFDTVICFRTLFALNHTNLIIKEMRRIAKPGGKLIFDYG